MPHFAPRKSRPVLRPGAACGFGSLLLLLPFLVTAAFADYAPVQMSVPEPLREFRGAWIAVVHNLDWPSSPGLSVRAQQAELTALLDKAVSLNLNAIVFQVRPEGDAVYSSSIEPWSPYLSGSMGVSPGYDPLAFAVKEAHRRGLELHAWFNPFRALAGNDYRASSTHAAREHPEYVRPYGSQRWLDPGEPWVRERALTVIRDVVRRYDVDGVHIDDYFYPYPNKDKSGNKIPFDDQASYARYGGGQKRDDWRRANVNNFVRSFYSIVKTEKPWVKVGISPFGIWRPGVPSGIEARLDAYQDIAADSASWLRNGWCDYFSPQLYWRIDPPEQSFSALLRWWHGQNNLGRHVWPGISTERIHSSDDPGRPAGEILRQAELARSMAAPGEGGHIHWSIKALRQNRDGVDQLLMRGPYAEKALIPASPWLGRAAPAAPHVKVAEEGKGLVLTWTPDVVSRWWAVQIKNGDRWSLWAVQEGSENRVSIPTAPTAVAVRGVSATGVLGAPMVLGR